MNVDELNFQQPNSFSSYIRSNRRWIILVLLLALGVRMAFMIYWPPNPNSGDAKLRYIPTAINLSKGNGFSIDKSPPYRPSVSSMPIYPLLIAFVYSIFGPNYYIISLIQIVLDLLTCLMVAYISFYLAPSSLKERAALFSLITYGVLSWFTLFFSAFLITETIAIFLTVLTVVLSILALSSTKKSNQYWFGAGLVCGIAILTRPDSVLLAGAVFLFLLFLAVLRRSLLVASSILCFNLAIGLSLLPWTIRNFQVFGIFEPLASEWGFADPHGYMPRGYLLWIRTWMTDETYFYYVFNQAFFPGTEPFILDALPDKFFDSEEEHQQVISLMKRYNETMYFTPDLEAEFRLIAEQRISRNPFRFYVFLPMKRIASLWLTGFATTKPNTNYKLYLRILSVLPIIIGGIIGLFWGRPLEVVALLSIIIIIRTLFMGYHYAPETRYIVELYPLIIAPSGITFAFISKIFLNGRFWHHTNTSHGNY